ncbi:hypothetical protein C3L33_09746, partial [Rhododendron williamsianum]
MANCIQFRIGGLKKDELISELLLSHPRPAVPYSGGPYSAYDKPVVYEIIVPELDLNSTSPQAQGEVRISDIHPDNGFSARDRITTMTECHDNGVGCSFNCVPEVNSSATSREQQAEVRISYIRSDNGFNVGDRPTTVPNCYDNDLDHAFNFDPDFSNGAASPQGRTEVRMAVTYTAPDQSLARLQRSKSRQKALEIRNSAKAAAKSRYAHENLTGACYSGDKMSRMVSQEIGHDIELFGLANYSDTVRECQGTAKNPNTYGGRITRSRSSYNLSSHESIAKEDGCPMIRSQSTFTEGTSKPVSSSYTASQRVARSKSGASKRPPLDNSLDQMERFQLNNVPGGEVVPHCPDSSAIVYKDVNADNIVESEVISNGLLEASHESIAKEDGCPMIRSQSTSTEGTSKPVSSSYTASQRVTRSKSGASKRPPLDNSLDRMEHFTSIMCRAAAISEFNLDLACPSIRFEASISRPPVFGMFVKPKTLDFGDMEKCLNKISGPMLEKGRLEKSAPKMSTPVKSAHSLVSDGPDKLLSSAGKGFDEKYMVQVQEDLCLIMIDSVSLAMTGGMVGMVGVTDPSSSGLDLHYCSAEDSQDLMHLEKSSDKGKMSGFVLRERTQLEKESHVEEDDLLAFGFTGSLELPLLQTSSLPVRRLRSAAENSWPQFKHRKVEGQQANFSSASPSCRAKEIHCIRVGGNLGTDLKSQYEGDVAQSSGDKIPDIEKHWEVKYNLTQETEPSAEMQLEQDELGFEKRNPGSDATSVFKNGHLGTSILSGFLNDTAEGFQDCSFENVETADTTHIDLDVRMPGDEIHYINKLHSGNNIALENEDDLTHPERMLQETEPRFEEGVPFSHFSIVSPQDKHLDSLDADQTMPEFERFMIDTEEDGDGFSLDKFDLPSTAIERASILEQLCRSASMHTPLPKFSTTFKLHRTPDLYQSVPNGLLEHTDLRSTLNLNNGGKQLRASYSNVGEVKVLSRVGKPWDWFSVNSSSSEKERSSNPELTCFPIEEDPNISEENENGDEEADIIQEDTCSTLLNGGAKREPLAELTAVSAVERFPDRSSLDSVDTEVSVTEAHSKVRQPLGNRNNNKRRCTTEAKEKSHFSVSTNCDKKATESLNSRFSKPKLLGKTSLRKGMQGLSEREPKHNNIVTNITSFVPFVQQKQAAAVATGKRDIKVKALEAAEAAKRLEEKKDNERKMKKEALKLERDKKVICGTQSDEELRKVQKMGNKQGDDNIGKKPHTELGASEILTSNLRQAALEDCEAFPRCGDTREPTSVLSKPTESNDLVKTSREKSYEISPYQCSDDEDEEEDEIPTSKYIPSWASKTSVALVLSSQQNIDPDVIFPPESFCSSDEAQTDWNGEATPERCCSSIGSTRCSYVGTVPEQHRK